MPLFFLSALLLLMPSSLWAAPQVTSAALVYDFGEVSQGDKVDHSFRFRNSGDALLEITSVSSSCGCTAALLSSRRIAPGESGEIKATFDSSRFRGRIKKDITIQTNDPAHGQVVFSLTGEVIELLRLSTTRIDWHWTDTQQTGTAEVTISNKSSGPVRLQNPQTTSPQLQASLDQLQLEPGQEARLTIQGQLAKDSKRLSGYVLVETDFAPLTQLRISVSGRLSN
ncbi:MAG: DUF1573 domain-containing protein [Deltaproteobacteria bacterium]|nr:DUF1573 domain-containing protein [Deltaproteobacteria bacterium]